ncbi:MAG: dihydrofolate reductase [Myxococcales bacterium]|nr:dihydrofolate reductase [Myxococcales bacterium]
MKDEPRELALIAAIGRGGVIGASDGHLGLPWHIPEDLRRFRALTSGHAIIMGRRTHELIGRPLPKRRNVVLTRSLARLEGCEVARDLDDALRLVADDPMPFVIGGASVYAEALPRCTRLFLTEIDREVVGDAFFPAFSREDLREVAREAGESPGVTFVTYERARPRLPSSPSPSE